MTSCQTSSETLSFTVSKIEDDLLKLLLKPDHIQSLRAFRRAGYVMLPSTKERTDRLPDMSVSLVGAPTSTISRPAPRGLEQGIVLNFWPNF